MRRVLIVDSNPDRLHALEAVMRGHDWQTASARQGAPALSIARREPPDLMLVALPLLLEERFVLLRHAKTTASLAPVALIVVSPPDVDLREEELVLDLGADAVLRFPSDAAAFMARVHALTSQPDASAERRSGSSVEPRAAVDPEVRIASLKKRIRLLERERTVAAEDGEHLRLALDAARIGTFVRDLKRQRVRWASGHGTLWDGGPLAVDETIAELEARVHPDDLPGLQQAMRHAIETRTEYEHEYRVVYDNDNVRWIQGRGRPYYDERGNPERVVGIYFEVTERRRLEQQVRQTQKMEAIGLLAGGIAHDFNNILSAMMGNEELLRRSLPAGQEAVSYLDELGKATRRAKNLVQQILAFSRDQPLEKVALSPVAALLETASLLRATLPADVQLSTRCAPDAPNILADATQLEQVLLNLGTNAWHALGGRPGRIELRLQNAQVGGAQPSPHPQLVPGRYAHIAVSDNGVGMPAEVLRRIFEPFFTTKPKGHGTGLGLAVVHEIVTEHRGVVWATSAPGAGTTFHLYFPATSQQERAVPAEEVADARPKPVPSRRVLYIDDEPALVRLMTKMLAPFGYRVDAFTDVEAALARFRAEATQFDLAITDLTMPAASGMDVAGQLLSIRPGLPIVLLSGYITSERREHARSLGVREVVPKPMTTRELCTAIESALRPE